MSTSIHQKLDVVLSTATSWKKSDQHLHCFWPMKGKQADGHLLVIGRALYGWCTKPFLASSCSDSMGRSEIIADAIAYSSITDNPITHLHETWRQQRQDHLHAYNPRMSSFWSVAETVSRQLLDPSKEPQQWTDALSWTNLFKLSLSPTGNPPASLRSKILQASVELLKAEIDAIRPKRILFLTGRWWAHPFLESCTLLENPPQLRYIHQIGYWTLPNGGRSFVVVADHPERKKRCLISSGILESFAQCHDEDRK